MVTDFLIAGAERLEQPESVYAAGPGAMLGAVLLSPFPLTIAQVCAEVAYWLHCVGVLLFLNFLPMGKHFHVITSFFNVYFRNLEAPGALPVVDLENTEQIGIKTSKDLTWSMGLDVYSCTECGRCNVYCPTVLTGKPLSHRQLNLDLKHALYEDQNILLGTDAKAKEELMPLVSKRISDDTIWACTTCGSCEQECPVYIENTPRIIQMRQHKVLMEGDMSPDLARVYKGMENNSNPWGLSSSERDAWSTGLDIPRAADIAKDGEIPLLYWIGCAGSFDDRNKKITLAMVNILKAAKVPFAILGKEEGCTGDIARRTGNEYLFQILAKSNIEILKQYRVQKILTHCPHCLHTLKADYPQFGGEFEVVHHTQMIDGLLESGALKLTHPVDASITWHDSCYLGRYHQIYDAPRKIGEKIDQLKWVEMPRHGSRSVCCGAGGGRFWMEEHIGTRINVHRSEEAVAMNTDIVGSSCPFCLIMMRDGVGHLGKENIQTLDIAEIVAQAIA
jgi:Fe-S oxidoreductase